jgi:hypothetical protein
VNFTSSLRVEPQNKTVKGAPAPFVRGVLRTVFGK